MSVSAMLETLQTQIQTRTAELPTLYAQIGRPSTALTDELNSLQKRLIDCVDEVVGGRRKEVQEWVEKCDAVEEQIQALLNAIGAGNIKGESDIVDKVLPKRLKQLWSQRERLQQLYTTKLEQRSTLCSRIDELVRILGDDFIPKYAEHDLTTNSLVDVSSDCISKLETDLARANSELSARRAALVQSFDNLSWLYNELGLELPTDPFSNGRTSTSKSGNPCSSVFECFTTSGADSLAEVEPTKDLIEWTVNRISELESLKSNRELQIQTLYDQLEPLWKRLAVDDKDVDKFVESWRGSTESVIDAVSQSINGIVHVIY
jgi:Ase1/PRC1/MAP65 family protein